jgi:hypothetical protein
MGITSSKQRLWGADRRGRMEIEPDRQEDPGRRFDLTETPRFPDNAGPGKTLRCQLSQSCATVGRACENRNGNTRENRLPMLPMADLREIVGAHQPDEIDSRPTPLQRGKCVGSEMRTESRFEIEDTNARIAGDAHCTCDAFLQGSHAGGGLERVLRRDQPPDFIEAKALQRLAADMQMALMRGIERAAEQADAPLRQMTEAGDLA